ncbi:undecaprenyl-diphosphatase, partial [Candidatus Peregrinibacteria bacterium CG_4_10_14_3_um_filter_44_21]
MTLLQAIFLGVLQGITEFLPISSSGHLVLAETILNLKAETLKSF